MRKRLTRKRALVAKREADVNQKLRAIEKVQDTIDEEVREKLNAERSEIAVEDARKAKRALG